MNNGCVHAACGQLDEEHMVRSDEKFADSQLEYCLCTSTFKQMQNRMMLINHCINELLYIIEREQVFGICNFLSWLRVPTDKIHCHRYDLALKIKPKKTIKSVVTLMSIRNESKSDSWPVYDKRNETPHWINHALWWFILSQYEYDANHRRRH